jgi:hypothetical protein
LARLAHAVATAFVSSADGLFARSDVGPSLLRVSAVTFQLYCSSQIYSATADS